MLSGRTEENEVSGQMDIANWWQQLQSKHGASNAATWITEGKVA